MILGAKVLGYPVLVHFCPFLETLTPYFCKCGPNDLNFPENVRCVGDIITEEFLHCWRSSKKQFFRKFEKKTLFSPRLGTFYTSTSANLVHKTKKCLETLVTLELQRICNNHEYHTIFTLWWHTSKEQIFKFWQFQTKFSRASQMTSSHKPNEMICCSATILT